MRSSHLYERKSPRGRLRDASAQGPPPRIPCPRSFLHSSSAYLPLSHSNWYPHFIATCWVCNVLFSKANWSIGHKFASPQRRSRLIWLSSHWGDDDRDILLIPELLLWPGRSLQLTWKALRDVTLRWAITIHQLLPSINAFKMRWEVH